jgi:hypothetical protein
MPNPATQRETSESPYKIFVSHAEADEPIAKAVKKVLNDAFDGHIEFFLAVERLTIGAKWKEEIANRLHYSVNKPWIYVEWSPFWLNDKPCYTLIVDNICIDQLIQPMIDRQIGNLLSRNQVVSLFKALTADSGAGAKGFSVPFTFVNLFIVKVTEAIEQKKRYAYSIYQETLETLPSSDLEKRPIAEYFFNQGEHDIFLRIVARIHSSIVKSDIINTIIEDSSFGPEETSGLVEAVADTIDGSQGLKEVASKLIAKGNLDVPELRHIVHLLGLKSRVELRKLAEELIARDLENTDLFEEIVEILAESSVAELKNLAIALIQGDRVESDALFTAAEKLIEMHRAPQLRDVARAMIRQDMIRSVLFRGIVEELLKIRPQEAVLVLNEVLAYDKVTCCQILGEWAANVAEIDPDLLQILDAAQGEVKYD